MSGLRYSVVVPVFNEAENIGVLCRRCRAELPPDGEVLICYDFADDNTLPALRALTDADKPVQLRLIHNTLGRGVRYAIEAGMRAAAAPVVVVMMADLSDDFAKVAEMIGRAEAGADVVCASRYMRGGRQIGGPRLKGLLSRLAGVSLHWLAGLPTHDATNSFKAYRREFLARTPIESQAGFCLGIELTVKAHFRGGRVEEVPARWTDRSAGQSRFRLFKWLPSYLHWYLWAMWHGITRRQKRGVGRQRSDEGESPAWGKKVDADCSAENPQSLLPRRHLMPCEQMEQISAARCT
jgi:dolichol-phosphate mannosyltransferase